MKRENQYIISFSGLKEGIHNFNFSLDKKFFEEYPVLESSEGAINIDVILNKTSLLLTFEMIMSGYLVIRCDRCLEEFNWPVEYRGQFYIKFKEDAHDSTDEIIFLRPNETEVNLKQYFLESIASVLPLQKIHPDLDDGSSGCKAEMLNLLDKHSSMDESTDDTTDPRWAKLKDIFKETK